MAKVSKAEMEIRLLEAEKLMTRLVAPTKVRAALMKKFKIEDSTARKYMTDVRKRWMEHIEKQNAAMPEIRDNRRLQMRQMLYDVIAQAYSRQSPLRDRAGKVVMDPKGSPIMVADPNLKAALSAMNQLRDLDALDQPKSAHLLVSGNVSNDSDGMSKEELEFFIATSRVPTPDELEAWKNRDH